MYKYLNGTKAPSDQMYANASMLARWTLRAREKSASGLEILGAMHSSAGNSGILLRLSDSVKATLRQHTQKQK